VLDSAGATAAIGFPSSGQTCRGCIEYGVNRLLRLMRSMLVVVKVLGSAKLPVHLLHFTSQNGVLLLFTETSTMS